MVGRHSVSDVVVGRTIRSYKEQDLVRSVGRFLVLCWRGCRMTDGLDFDLS